MDKPSQIKPYAGLVIYRLQKNVEFLLLSDPFANKKNWFCPKGQVIGNEDKIKCALRETFEATGLDPRELYVEEDFDIEIQYLSGTKPKKVKYYLAQLSDSHIKLLPDARVQMQWFNLVTCSEKVVFKTMQEVFKCAEAFIAVKHAGRSNNYHRQQHDKSDVKSLSINGSEEGANKPMYRPRNQQLPQQPIDAHNEHQLQQHTQQQNSPLYKTRLCERFETEGSCPYGSKCNFAHGIVDLRGRFVTDPSHHHQQQQQHQLDKNDDHTNVDSNGNQLFKTKLCEKFIKDKFCQYGPKCHFAHGEEELKTRPKKEETAPIIDRRPSPPSQQHRHQRTVNNENITNHVVAATDTQEVVSPADKRTNWRSATTAAKDKHIEVPMKTEPTAVEGTIQRLPVHHHVSLAPKSNELSPVTRDKKETNDSPAAAAATAVSPAVSVEELRRPAFVEHQRSNLQKKKTSSPTVVVAATSGHGHGKDKKHAAKVENNEKSWMKIVKLSKEEHDEMENQTRSSKSVSNSTTKLTQKEEPIIIELRTFFSSNPPSTTTTTEGKLTMDVKEVTKIEMRNDLSKKQLLYILLVSLLEVESDQSMLTILKSRDHLFKTLVKTKDDQKLLLAAWDSFVTVRKSAMVTKTTIALSHWYDCAMVEEEVFLEWFQMLEKDSILEKKSSKFIDWLNASESEEDE